MNVHSKVENPSLAANIHYSVEAKKVLEKLFESRYDEPNLQHIFADYVYRGNLKKWVQKKLNMSLTIAKRTDKTKDWKIQSKWWIVQQYYDGMKYDENRYKIERTNTWKDAYKGILIRF